MKKLLTFLACAAIVSALASCEKEEKSQKLDTPVPTVKVTKTSFTISWPEVANAVAYVGNFQNEDKTVTETTATYENIAPGNYNISVTAKGDGEKYLDSEPGYASVEIEQQKLATPVLTIEKGETSAVVTWEAVENATSYKYIFNEGEELTTEETRLEFTDLLMGNSYTIEVQALTTDEAFKESSWATRSFAIMDQRWVGTWTATWPQTLTVMISDGAITSTEFSNNPVTAELEITEDTTVPGRYLISGLSAIFKPDEMLAVAIMTTGAANSIDIYNEVSCGSPSNGFTPTWLAFAEVQNTDGSKHWQPVPGNAPVCTLTLDETGGNATSSYVKEPNITIHAFDVFGFQSTNAIGFYYPEGSHEGDPITLRAGEFTLVKK